MSLRSLFWPLLRLGLFASLGLFAGLGADIPAWRLVWADEFDQSNGSAPDPSRWKYDVGGGGWGNRELQTYTARRQNSYIQDGHLVIEARRETLTGPDQIRRDYTSARLKTQGLAAWKYGRIEARVRVPTGKGVWPAVWMLGSSIAQVGWPACGELDIMEHIGREPSMIHGTAHGPGFGTGTGLGGSYTLTGNGRFDRDFHVFAMEWETNRIRWLMDERAYFVLTPAQLPKGAEWVFTEPQFLLLNLAVGGDWPGAPDASTVFPQRMWVDYVRVYARTTAPEPDLQLRPRADGTEARWSARFPQAWVEGAATMDGPWKIQPGARDRLGDEFVLAVPPGFYRLRW